LKIAAADPGRKDADEFRGLAIIEIETRMPGERCRAFLFARKELRPSKKLSPNRSIAKPRVKAHQTDAETALS
jgi:hypothetical protein